MVSHVVISWFVIFIQKIFPSKRQGIYAYQNDRNDLLSSFPVVSGRFDDVIIQEIVKNLRHKMISYEPVMMSHYDSLWVIMSQLDFWRFLKNSKKNWKDRNNNISTKNVFWEMNMYRNNVIDQ